MSAWGTVTCAPIVAASACLSLTLEARAVEPPSRAAENRANTDPHVRWPAPVLTDDNLAAWQTFIRPGAEELKWRDVRWHTSLAPAVDEARRLERPILLWTMNGNPCGET